MMTWHSPRNERLCTPDAVKRGSGETMPRQSGMSTTGRIHILASHATLAYLHGWLEPSPTQVLKAWSLSGANTVCWQKVKSRPKRLAYLPATEAESYGRLELSQLPCGILKSVYFGRLVLIFECAEHGSTSVNLH